MRTVFLIVPSIEDFRGKYVVTYLSLPGDITLQTSSASWLMEHSWGGQVVTRHPGHSLMWCYCRTQCRGGAPWAQIPLSSSKESKDDYMSKCSCHMLQKMVKAWVTTCDGIRAQMTLTKSLPSQVRACECMCLHQAPTFSLCDTSNMLKQNAVIEWTPVNTHSPSVTTLFCHSCFMSSFICSLSTLLKLYKYKGLTMYFGKKGYAHLTRTITDFTSRSFQHGSTARLKCVDPMLVSEWPNQCQGPWLCVS